MVWYGMVWYGIKSLVTNGLANCNINHQASRDYCCLTKTGLTKYHGDILIHRSAEQSYLHKNSTCKLQI